MTIGIRTGDPHGYNKGRGSEFRDGSRFRSTHIGRNVVEITISMKTIVRKPVMIKINKLRLRNFDN